MIYYVYIITNKPKGTLYVGVINCLQRRTVEHKSKAIKGFSERYNLTKLVYSQSFRGIAEAINFEKRIKRWHREWKINLIEKNNPQWNDLYLTHFSNLDPEINSG